MTLAAARAALAPRGVLRAAINLSNFLLVSDQPGATPRGISPSLCGALAQRLEVPLELVDHLHHFSLLRRGVLHVHGCFR